MKMKRSRLARLLLLAFATAPAWLFAYLGQTSRLLVDDYYNLGLTRTLGTWEAMRFVRQNWKGDYSDFLVYGLLTPLDTVAPSVFPLVIIASGIAGFGWIAWSVLAGLGVGARRRTIALALASLALAATINGFYSGQVFYWLSAAVEYSFPTIALMLGIAFAAELGQKLHSLRQMCLAGAGLAFLAFMVAGFSELHLVAQLTFASLLVVYSRVAVTGSKRRVYSVLAVAALLGTLASLPVQLTAPGLAYRSQLPMNFGHAVQPVRDLPVLLNRALSLTLQRAGHPAGFAGFMLVAAASFFAVLAADARSGAIAGPRKGPGRRALLASLAVQLVFAPILWTHISDAPQFLSRFSATYMIVICLNALSILVLLSLLWRRPLRESLFDAGRRQRIFVSCGLAAACLLFALTQARSIHYKAATYLMVSAIAALLTLAAQLKSRASDRRLDQASSMALLLVAAAPCAFAAVAGVSLWGAGYTVARAFASVIFLLMASGLLCGLTLGA